MRKKRKIELINSFCALHELQELHRIPSLQSERSTAHLSQNFGESTYHFEVWVNAIKRHELSHTDIKFIFADIFQP